jgi:hypothetical protein
MLILLVAGAAVLALIAFAIARRRPGFALAIGGLAALGLVLVLGLLFTYRFVHQPRVAHVPAPIEVGAPMSDATQFMTHKFHDFTSHNSGSRNDFSAGGDAESGSFSPSSDVHRQHVSWQVSSFRVFIFIGLIALVLAIVAKRLLSPGASCGGRKIWPAFLLIPLVLVFFWGSARVRSSRSVNVPVPPIVAQQHAIAEHSRAESRAKMERRRAELVVTNGQQELRLVNGQPSAAQTSISDEIDQFDAPRIPLPPAPPSPKESASAPKTPAPPVVIEPPSKSKSGDDSKSVANSSGNRKKTKRSPRDESKRATAAAENKSSESNKLNERKGEPAVSPNNSPLAAATPDKPAASPPAWIHEPPKFTGNVRREVISTDEYESIDECYRAADIYLLLKTYDRMLQIAGQPAADSTRPSIAFQQGGIITADGHVVWHGIHNPHWGDPRLIALNNIGIGTDYVRRFLVTKDPKNNDPREYVETVERSFGPMKKLYLQIEFTPSLDNELRRYWDSRRRQERFWMFGAGAFYVLGFIGCIFGLLKLDTWTKGYYTKRLFIGVPAAIIGVWLLLIVLDTYTSLL